MTDLYVGNTMEVNLEGDGALKDQDGSVVTGATVEVTVKDMGGSEVAGETWPVVLTEEGNGEYAGRLSANADLKDGKLYEVEVVATKSSTQAKWSETRYARQRTF